MQCNTHFKCLHQLSLMVFSLWLNTTKVSSPLQNSYLKPRNSNTPTSNRKFSVPMASAKGHVDLQMLSAQSACQNSVALNSEDMNNKNILTHCMAIFQITMNRTSTLVRTNAVPSSSVSSICKLRLKCYLWFLFNIKIYPGPMLNKSFGGVIVLLFTVASVLVLSLI